MQDNSTIQVVEEPRLAEIRAEILAKDVVSHTTGEMVRWYREKGPLWLADGEKLLPTTRPFFRG